MDEMETLDEIEVVAWARLLKASTKLLAEVERDLKEAGLPPLAWYDALLELHRTRPDGLRPGDLEAKMLLPQYNVSRLVDRLEAAGYAVRRPHPQDGRGQVLQITDAGTNLIKRMWKVYGRTIAGNFAGKLNAGDAKRLAGLLQRLL
jgi:DNA-binding MarR family transcriptional regulator